MDVVWLARLQFAITIMFHFLFPPISIGLGFLIFLLETARRRTGKDVYRRASDFWLKIFAVTFVVGVASGIVMEFQFGTNWASYSRFVGDVFGAPLAAEGVFAFFLESGFLGLLILGRKRISSFTRWFASLMVSFGTILSSFWILVANSWMQTPAGYRIVDGRAELTDFWAAVFNPSTLPRLGHTLSSALCMGSFVMVGGASWYFLKGRHPGVARVSMRFGVPAALAGCVLAFLTGDRHATQVAHTQHAKFAAMEGLYSTEKGAPLILFSLPPTQEGPRPGPEIVITDLTSALAFGNFRAPIKGLSEFPKEDWPPVAVTFLAFHNMVILANVMLLLALAGVYLLVRGRIETARWWQRLMVLAVPLPMIAIQLGWLTAEVGRQPWIVYGLMRTKDGVSKVVDAPSILFSIILFSILYLFLGALWLYLLRREFEHGPEPAHLPDADEEAKYMPSLETVWFLLVGVLLAGYAILDGFDLGAGMLHLFVAKTDDERRSVLNAVGPVWDGNEVWLLTGAGALFAAFPKVYATVFSGMYLALMLVLAALILRAVCLEFRSKEKAPAWRRSWDVVFAVSSFLPSLLFGVAIGNIVRGLPLDAEQEFAGTFLGLLNPFALLTGLLSVAMFLAQGAAWLQMKTLGPVRERSLAAGRWAWFAWFVLWGAVTLYSRVEAPHSWSGAGPALWAIPALFFFFMAGLRHSWGGRRPAESFFFSSAAIAMLLAGLGAAIYPNLVPALGNPEGSLTIWNASSSTLTLKVMLTVALIGMPIVIGYTIFIYTRFKGPVRLDDHSY